MNKPRGFLLDPTDGAPGKASTGRLVIVIALVAMIAVYLYVLYFISWRDQPFADYSGFLKDFRTGLQWLGLGGYGLTKTKETVVERRNGGAE